MSPVASQHWQRIPRPGTSEKVSPGEAPQTSHQLRSQAAMNNNIEVSHLLTSLSVSIVPGWEIRPLSAPRQHVLIVFVLT